MDINEARDVLNECDPYYAASNALAPRLARALKTVLAELDEAYKDLAFVTQVQKDNERALDHAQIHICDLKLEIEEYRHELFHKKPHGESNINCSLCFPEPHDE